MRVLVTRTIAEEGIAVLRAAGISVDVWAHETPMPVEVLMERARRCSGLLTMLTDPIDAAVLDPFGPWPSTPWVWTILIWRRAQTAV